jgi:serine/threonine protein kinase
MGMTRQRTFTSSLSSYRTTELLGEGGAGHVYKVVDEQGGAWALKVLRKEHVGTEKFRRFKNEVMFGRKNQHPNILIVVDDCLAGVEQPFYVMRLYEQPLGEAIADGIPAERALDLFGQLLSGMAAAHAARVIHRDLKPTNILLDEGGTKAVISDFGIAHFEEHLLHTAVKTREGDRLANFQYAAPEQRVKGTAVDHRADIFALGLILNELFTKTVPHGSGYPRIRDVRRDLAYLDDLVEQMTQHNPADRLQTVEVIADRLKTLRSSPAVRAALDVDAALAFEHRKKRAAETQEGVDAAAAEAGRVFARLISTAEQITRTTRHVKLESGRDSNTLTIRGSAASIMVSWYRPVLNILDAARLTVWSYRGRRILPTERGHIYIDGGPTEVGEDLYYPEYLLPGEWHWRDARGTKRNSITLADLIMEEFLKLEAQEAARLLQR